MTPVALPFRVGARTLATVPRRLVRVALSLDEVLGGDVPGLPPLGEADGYLITSLPEPLLPALTPPGFVAAVRQRYVRYHVDLTIGREAWLAGLSANARGSIKRKAKRLAGVTLDIRRYRTSDEIAVFHPIARTVSAATYQERLLGEGLPHDAGALTVLAAADRLRAWLLFVGDRPAAYLCCSAEDDVLRYDHVGHDPAFNHLSPGAVLQVEALRDLFTDRFARFDFTEGEGQHKRQLATDGTACVDLLLLRPTLANRVTVAALAGFDAAVARAKRLFSNPRFHTLRERVRRA